jgi:hypothetical protein
MAVWYYGTVNGARVRKKTRKSVFLRSLNATVWFPRDSEARPIPPKRTRHQHPASFFSFFFGHALVVVPVFLWLVGVTEFIDTWKTTTIAFQTPKEE